METTARPSSLLSSARAFVRKSATLAILPLAVATQAHAIAPPADPTFLAPSFSSGGYVSGFSFSGGTYAENSFSSSQLPIFNGIIGSTQSMDMTFTVYGSGSGSFNMYLGGSSVFGGTPIGPGTSIPTSYGFTLGTSGSLTVTSWTLYFGVSDATTPSSVTGSGLGTFSGSVNLITGTTTSYYYPYLVVNATGAASSEQFSVNMTSLSYNAVSAVPEPSTYALLFGLAAVGAVVFRRRLAAQA